MKTAPAFDDVLGKSHLVNTRCELRAPDDTVVGTLPVEAGRVTGDATRRVDRWEGSLTLAGLEWAPRTATDPLSGLSGHYVSVQRAANPYGQQETWVEVARLWVYETRVSMSRRNATCQVRLTGPGALIERAGYVDWQPNQGETPQQFMARLLSHYLPYTPTVLDTSTVTDPLPAEFRSGPAFPMRVADQVAEFLDARVYFDALGRIVIRDTLPALDVSTLAPARPLSIKLDVTGYTLTMGRERFCNDVAIQYDYENPPGTPRTTRGLATISTGPLARGGPAGRLTWAESSDLALTTNPATRYAQSVLRSMQSSWVTSRITAVQDPRLEPDDIVETEYLDRTLRHRVVGVSFDLTTDAMEITARTALPTGGP